MISYTLSDLDNSNIYQKSLQIIEDICDEYGLNNEFGIISMANQFIVDYLSEQDLSYSMEICFNVDNDSLDIQYVSNKEIFSMLEFGNDSFSLLNDLVDHTEKNIDNKSLGISFHVKPRFSIHRQLEKSAILNKTCHL